MDSLNQKPHNRNSLQETQRETRSSLEWLKQTQNQEKKEGNLRTCSATNFLFFEFSPWSLSSIASIDQVLIRYERETCLASIFSSPRFVNDEWGEWWRECNTIESHVSLLHSIHSLFSWLLAKRHLFSFSLSNMCFLFWILVFHPSHLWFVQADSALIPQWFVDHVWSPEFMGESWVTLLNPTDTDVTNELLNLRHPDHLHLKRRKNRRNFQEKIPIIKKFWLLEYLILKP